MSGSVVRGRVCSCSSLGRCLSLRRGTLGLTRGVWEGVRGESGWAGGLRHAARGTRQRQAAAAGSRRQAAGGLPTKLLQADVVLAQLELHVRLVDAVHHGYVLGVGAWWRWSVAERYLRRAGRSARRRRRRRRAAEGEHEDGKHAAQARCIAPGRRCLEQVVAVEKSQIPIFKNVERRIPRRRTSWRPRVGGGGRREGRGGGVGGGRFSRPPGTPTTQRATKSSRYAACLPE